MSASTTRPSLRPAVACRDASGLVAVAVVVEATRRAHSQRVAPPEARTFRWFNARSDRLERPAWLVMQSGSFGAIGVVTAELARRGRTRSAVVVGATGGAVWLGVRAIKPAIGRGRPSAYLADVVVRGRPQTGLGYPSGHAAVAASLATMTIGSRCGTGAAAAIACASVVGATRMYVGAHLPYDIAGGLAIGTLAGWGGRRLRRWAES